jgi:hypothetical protein
VDIPIQREPSSEPGMSKKPKRNRSTFTNEHEARSVELVRTSGKSADPSAEDLDIVRDCAPRAGREGGG